MSMAPAIGATGRQGGATARHLLSAAGRSVPWSAIRRTRPRAA